MAFYQKILNNGESFSEGSDPGGNNETKDSYTYTVKEGHYVMVTRIWQDKIEWGDSKVEPYTVDNVKEYITSGGVKKPTKTTSARYSQTGSIYNCKGYELTEDQITTVSQVLYAEFGYNIEGAKNVASQMCNLYEKSGSKSSFFDWLRSGGGKAWYAGNRNSGKTNDDMKEAVRQCIVEGKRTLPPFVDNFVTYASKWVTPYYGNDISKYVQGETHINETSAMGSNPAEGTFWCVDQAPNGIEGGNLFFYDENYRKKCEESQNYTVTGDGAKSSTTSSVSSLDNFLFLGDSLTYGLKEEGGISNAKFIGVIGSSAAHWNKWLKGEKTKWDSNIDFTGKTMPGENEISGVCIMLGFNALDGGNSVDTAVKDMKEYIDKICSLYPNKPIYVEKVLPCRSGVQVTNASATNEGIKKYNEQISSYCSSKGVLFIDTTDGYVGSDGQLAEEKSQDGVHLKDYKTLANNITKAITSSDVTTNLEAVNVNTKGLESFTIEDQDYYRLLYADKEINRVDMMNARPENYLQYLERGAQYSNHVGYSRGYMIFSYDELKRLFKERFESKKLPFAYGSSLGYETFKPESYVLEAGSVSGTISGTNILSGSSMGALEKDPSKKNILIIAGHSSDQRELPGTMQYTEPTQNRKIAMALAGALETAGLNPVIANRVMAHNSGKGDYEDSYGVIWGDEDVYLASNQEELFSGYDYIIELHHNASSGSAKGALLTYPSDWNVTDFDRNLLQCFVNNNLGNSRCGDVQQGLRNMSTAKSLNIPMTYIECEFYDNNEAMAYIEQNYNKIAGEMAMLFREHFGVTTPINTENGNTSDDSSTDGAGVSVMGSSKTDKSKMVSYLKNQNPSLSDSYINELIDAYISEGNSEGVRADIAFAQACVETDRFKFDMGTAVTIDQNNFCGMGVTTKGLKGNSFPSIQIGVRAQIQHLKAYCSTEALNTSCVDPRFDLVSRGKANDVKGLGGNWAADVGYGKQIMSVLQAIQAS